MEVHFLVVVVVVVVLRRRSGAVLVVFSPLTLKFVGILDFPSPSAPFHSHHLCPNTLGTQAHGVSENSFEFLLFIDLIIFCLVFEAEEGWDRS